MEGLAPEKVGLRYGQTLAYSCSMSKLLGIAHANTKTLSNTKNSVISNDTYTAMRPYKPGEQRVMGLAGHGNASAIEHLCRI